MPHGVRQIGFVSPRVCADQSPEKTDHFMHRCQCPLLASQFREHGTDVVRRHTKIVLVDDWVHLGQSPVDIDGFLCALSASTRRPIRKNDCQACSESFDESYKSSGSSSNSTIFSVLELAAS